MTEEWPECYQCKAGHHDRCDGFRDTLDGPGDGEPCGCKIRRHASKVY